jgi:hypothetical protein
MCHMQDRAKRRENEAVEALKKWIQGLQSTSTTLSDARKIPSAWIYANGIRDSRLEHISSALTVTLQKDGHHVAIVSGHLLEAKNAVSNLAKVIYMQMDPSADAPAACTLLDVAALCHSKKHAVKHPDARTGNGQSLRLHRSLHSVGACAFRAHCPRYLVRSSNIIVFAAGQVPSMLVTRVHA